MRFPLPTFAMMTPIEPTSHLDSRPAPPPKWVLWVLVGAVAGLYILGFATTGLTPKLLKDHPLALMALSPRYRNFLLVWNRVDFAPFLVVGVLRLLVSDPVYYLLGRFYGDGAIRWFENAMGGPQSGGQLVRLTEKWFGRFSVPLCAFFAGPIVCVLAGAAGVKPKRFFTLDAIGTIGVVLVLRMFGRLLKSPLNWMVKFNSHNWKWLTVIAVLSTGFFLIKGGRAHKKFSSLGDLEELDRERRED